MIGERCDHCPHRWVLIDTEGCFKCDSCTHGLLDATDEMENIISPTLDEFEVRKMKMDDLISIHSLG